MKYSDKKEELKCAFEQISSCERRIKMMDSSWYIKGYKNEICRLKMKINKLKFQIGF